MNWGLLRDSKIILGFVFAFVFEIIGILLAIKNEDSWVTFVVFGMLLTFYSVYRANLLYRKN